MNAKATRRSGFFNLRVLVNLSVILGGIFVALLGIGTFSKASAQACDTYITTTGTGTITPGDTDTGNHCDDCYSSILLPFPVSVYGQTFITANATSNGALELIGNSAPYTHGCVTLPNGFWNMAILAYQGDLRTDQQAGCAGFPGGNCGIFTSVTGTAPNRSLTLSGGWWTTPTPLLQRTLKWCSTRIAKASLTSSTAQLLTMAVMRRAACRQA